MSNVTHPKHYNQGKIEVIEFIEDKALGFHRGNAVKYLCRAGLKDPTKFVEDLQKAIWYIQREIEILVADRPRRPNEMNFDSEKYDAEESENKAALKADSHKPNDMHPLTPLCEALVAADQKERRG